MVGQFLHQNKISAIAQRVSAPRVKQEMRRAVECVAV